jgi:hypothetical protein
MMGTVAMCISLLYEVRVEEILTADAWESDESDAEQQSKDDSWDFQCSDDVRSFQLRFQMDSSTERIVEERRGKKEPFLGFLEKSWDLLQLVSHRGGN